MSHFHVNVDSNALKKKRGSPRGEKIHANVNAFKRELRNALFSLQNQTFLIASFLKGLVVDIDCSVRKESLFESSWKIYENVTLSSFHAAHAENWKRTELVF